MPPLTPSPDDLAAALSEVQQGNVTTGLDFHLHRALDGKDPALCYAVELIQAAAGSMGSQVRDASNKLKQRYGKDFSIPRFNADVKEARADLSRRDPVTSKLLVSDNGAIKPILANAILELQKHVHLGFDSFSSVVTHLKPSAWGTSATWSDLDDVSAANHLQHAGVSVSGAVAHEAAYYLAHQNKYHPVKDWLTALVWDGQPRLESLFADYFGCEDMPFTHQVSMFWCMSAVARIMQPGCIAKYMVVLEGPQNEGKSKALRALTNGHLAGHTGVQWFRDNMPKLDHKDLGMYMQGVWIIEIAELSAIRGKEWEEAKAFISSPRETFRVPFGRNMQDYPRQCIFAGSTNENQWGGDPTGLTRFWPMRTGKLRIDDILRDRDQIWAEARTLFDEGKPWYGDAEFDKLAKVEQEQRAPEDTVGDDFLSAAEALAKTSEDGAVTVREVMNSLDIPKKDRKSEGAMIGRILTRSGWRITRPYLDGDRVRRYKRPMG